MVKLTMTSVMRQIQFYEYGKFDLQSFIFKGIFLLSLELKENTDIQYATNTKMYMYIINSIYDAVADKTKMDF